MKKLSYTTILAAACLLLPGCSDDAADKALVSPDVLVADSEVEIKLSSGSSTMATRAGVYEQGGSFSTTVGNYMAIFCLADGIQPGTVDVPEINWTRNNPIDDNDVRIWNMPASVNNGEIKFKDDKKYFYPTSNAYKYGFYGYYTRQGDAKVTLEVTDETPAGQEVIVSFEGITGYNDVLWGSSPSSTDQTMAVDGTTPLKDYAYSAKYYREHIKRAQKENTDDASQVPTLEFKHVMTRFYFSVNPCDEGAVGMTIKSIKLLDIPANGKLMLASNREEPSMEPGTIVKVEDGMTISPELYDVEYAVGDDGLVTETLSSFNKSPYTITGEDLNTTFVLGGEGSPAAFYVLPEKEYTFQVTMEKDGNSFVSQIPVTLKEDNTAGYEYKVTLAVYGPQEIELKATLAGWNEGTEPPVIEL